MYLPRDIPKGNADVKVNLCFYTACKWAVKYEKAALDGYHGQPCRGFQGCQDALESLNPALKQLALAIMYRSIANTGYTIDRHWRRSFPNASGKTEGRTRDQAQVFHRFMASRIGQAKNAANAITDAHSLMPLGDRLNWRDAEMLEVIEQHFGEQASLVRYVFYKVKHVAILAAIRVLKKLYSDLPKIPVEVLGADYPSEEEMLAEYRAWFGEPDTGTPLTPAN